MHTQRSRDPAGCAAALGSLPRRSSVVKDVGRRADDLTMAWWGWVLIGWIGLSVVLAPLVGMTLRVAERRGRVWFEAARPGVPAAVQVAASPPRRRRIPVPPLAVTLIGVGVSLEAVGFVVHASGQERGTAGFLSMDQPLSIPRMYITGLLAAAALLAFLGASRAPGRRTWWLAVGAIAAVLAQVKGGGTVHVRALEAFGVGDRPVLAALGSALVAGVVLGGLWWLSCNERRDRRRVLGAFTLYAAASVGLSAGSSLVGQSLGSPWAASATFLEESGEVAGAVVVLIAVLVGVAPRLVLPATWPVRRTADAETVDAPGALPTWPSDSRYLPG